MAEEENKEEESEEEVEEEEEEEKDEDKEETKEEEEDETDEEDEEVEVPEKFESIVEEISEMTVTDLAELVEILEDKFGVSAQAPAAAPAAAPAGDSEEGGGEEEKSNYDVELAEIGDSKIDVIKVVRNVTEKGLKDAKALVDDVPEVIMNDVDKEEAEDVKEQFEEAGASVNLK